MRRMAWVLALVALAGCTPTTPEEAAAQKLEAELHEVEGKISAQERTAGLAGLAPTQALTDLYDRRDALKAGIEKARAKR